MPRVDFALIGHLDTWDKISRVFHSLRRTEHGTLSITELRELVPWIPPRVVVHVTIRSYPSLREAQGVYIDTFITPDELDASRLKKNLSKVQDAAACAVRTGARIVALGGFTSIALEGDVALLQQDTGTAFTTGNTLTAAYIVKGLEVACALHGMVLGDCRLLIVGATGDVGSGCLSYFAGKTKEIILCARNRRRLEQHQAHIRERGLASWITVDPNEGIPAADLIILAASVPLPTFSLAACKPHALICDAGYPKNADPLMEVGLLQRVFHGGLGRVLGGFRFEPELIGAFYEYPLPNIGHGCMLEGALLALEERYETYSQGRGQITADRIEEIWALAQKHGMKLSPFFNQAGLWDRQPVPRGAEVKA